MSTAWKKLLFAVAALPMTAPLPRAAWAYLGLPGSTWGEITQDFSGFEGLGTMGYLSQGVDWAQLPGEFVFNTSAEMTWQFRRRHAEYYNTWGPVLSASLRRSFYRFGAEFANRHYPELHETSDQARLFGTWYKGWLWGRALKGSRVLGIPIGGLPGDTWGRLSESFDSLEGFTAQGFINQGIRWDVMPSGMTLDTYAEYRWRVRTKNDAYYNAHGPALGIRAGWSAFKLGIQYQWQVLPELGQTNDGAVLFLNWYFDWDLHRR